MKLENDNAAIPKLWNYLAYLVILIGIALRLFIYFQNRNLFQDEANIARNIYERDFFQLTLPLSYFQYAPPLFLWILKCLTGILGYSEYVLRLVPLLSGIGSLWLTYILLRKFGVKKMLWYPLFLLSTGYIYIRYSTELKQYSFDSLVALSLIYLDLTVDTGKLHLKYFLGLWLVFGSLAVWSSMPSVFILSGIVVYYFFLLYRSYGYKGICGLSMLAIIWLIQFGFYYETILKAQIQSDYLQLFHKESFLILFPKTRSDLIGDWAVILNVLEAASGYWFYAIKFHLLLIVVAFYLALRNKALSFTLLIVPIILLFFAAGLHQFALTPRIVLFAMPLLLILIGIGLEQLFTYRYIRIVALGLSFVCIYQFNELKYFGQPLQVVQITDCMDFLVGQNIKGDQLHVEYLAYPAYNYYTVIHPRNKSWQSIKSAGPLNYQRFDSLSLNLQGRMAILYGSTKIDLINRQQKQINEHLTMLMHYSGTSCQAYIYRSN